MKNRDLIKLLNDLPQDAEVFINGKCVDGAETREGKISTVDGAFRELPNKRDTIVTLTHWNEISTGEQVQSSYWPSRGGL